MSERRRKVRFGAEGEERVSVAESRLCWLMAKVTVNLTDVKWDVYSEDTVMGRLNVLLLCYSWGLCRRG